jgi:hypothetical protein
MNPMSEKEVLEFRQSSNWHLRQGMDRVQKEFQLDSYPKFAWHPWRGELVFSSGSAPQVVARIQVAGTLAGGKITSWTWAWANASLPASVKQAALSARKFGEERVVLALQQPKWAATESDAWHMTAVVCRLADAKSAFKIPGKESSTFLVLTDVRPAGDRKRVFGARLCPHVVEGERPILLVSREADGDVLALCGGEDDDPDALRHVGLDSLLELDRTLWALADLPDGWAAVRESPDDDWVRSKAE